MSSDTNTGVKPDFLSVLIHCSGPDLTPFGLCRTFSKVCACVLNLVNVGEDVSSFACVLADVFIFAPSSKSVACFS